MEGIILAIVLVLIVVGTTIITFVGPWGLPELASNWGSIDSMIIVTTIVTMIAFIAVNAVMAYFIYRYRHRDGRRAVYLVNDHRLEKILIIVTSIGIVFLLAPGLFVYSSFIQPPADALKLEVVSQQWAWAYRYPGADGKLGRSNIRFIDAKNSLGVDLKDPAGQDDVAISAGGTLHLPVNKPVELELRAKDVLHSFYVPQFRVKMDTVPGGITRLWFTPNKAGTFEVLCAELCGIGHYKMKSSVIVESEEEFQKWLKQQPTVSQTLGTK
ncbi:cytochrome c oxidase subunit II [Candidatus Acetothermia bacterium]|nr:cytochrome c oxidase subunit II [Candidatus Acetothermia bacterium]